MEIKAASCARSDVQAAIDKAISGDVVTVPAGECEWTDKVAVNKGVAVMGRGVEATFIHWAPERAANNAPFWIQTSDPWEVSQFTFRRTGQATDKGIVFYGWSGSAQGWRIHRNKFDDIGMKAITHWGNSSGLIDHNQFIGDVRGMDVNGTGDASWERPWTPGSGDAIFIEDNLFDQSARYPSVSCHLGGRYTFRYNTVIRGGVSLHGADSSARAGGVMEVYGNRFTSDPDHDRAIILRGGTGIIFDNVFDGYTNVIGLAQYRTCYGESWSNAHPSNASRCDGSQPVDGNEAIHAGSHNGESGKATLEDETKNFTPDKFVGWHVWNLSDGSKGKITANGATTVTAQLAGGSRNSWNAGDQYKIASGWPCRDQVGRGPNQSYEPVYQWNNLWSRFGGEYISPEAIVSSYWCEGPSPADQVRKDRDYFDNVERPGYAPFTYPHPLTGEEAQDPVEPMPDPTPEPDAEPDPEPTPDSEEPVKEPDLVAKPDPPTGLVISEKGANAELMWDGSLTPSDFYRVWRSDGRGDLKAHATTAVPFFSESHPGRRGPWHYGVSVVIGGVESDISCCVIYRGK